MAKKFETYTIKTKFRGKTKQLGGVVALNKTNALKQAKKIWKGHPYGKSIMIGKVIK